MNAQSKHVEETPTTGLWRTLSKTKVGDTYFPNLAWHYTWGLLKLSEVLNDANARYHHQRSAIFANHGPHPITDMFTSVSPGLRIQSDSLFEWPHKFSEFLIVSWTFCKSFPTHHQPDRKAELHYSSSPIYQEHQPLIYLEE